MSINALLQRITQLTTVPYQMVPCLMNLYHLRIIMVLICPLHVRCMKIEASRIKLYLVKMAGPTIQTADMKKLSSLRFAIVLFSLYA